MSKTKMLKAGGESIADGKASPAEWTVMIYFAGDNNLAQDCVDALLAIKGLRLGDHTNVIAQFDPGDPRVSTRRLVIDREQRKNQVDGLVKHVLGRLDGDRVLLRPGTREFRRRRREHREEIHHEAGVFETDTADPKTLFDFISWSSEHFPAKKYMLVLAGHGAGIEDGFLLKDEHPAQAMKLDGLKKVLQQVQETLDIKLEILGMDSCLMSMGEICLELKDFVNVLVGSQSMTPNPGWPYAEIIGFINKAKGNITAEELAPKIVHSYIRSYVDQAINSGTSTDLAALKVDGAGVVASAVGKLARRLEAGLEDSALLPTLRTALVLSHWEAQSYNGELFVDLSDFCDLLIKNLTSVASGATDARLGQTVTRIEEACKGVKEAIRAMVLESCFCGIDYQYSNGVSIYFPWSTIFFDYRNLQFAKRRGANWHHFLRKYISATRRPPRGDGNLDNRDDRGQESIRFNFEVFTRRVQPLDHGPTTGANSMRNPPRRLGNHKIKGCAHLADI